MNQITASAVTRRASNTEDRSGIRLIIMRPLRYKDQEQIALHFEYDPTLKELVKGYPEVRWTQTHKCFYMPGRDAHIKGFLKHIQGKGVWVDTSAIATFLDLQAPHQVTPYTGTKRTSARKPVKRLNASHEMLVTRMTEKILLKGYSPSTLKNYIHHIKSFLAGLSPDRDPLEMTKDDIEQYLLGRQKSHRSSESDINMHINAIKFLYEQVLGKDRMLFYLPRPEKPLKLPKVLGEHELERLFRAVSNLKHKAILMTAFSCGLRVSEVIRLRLRDIDSERMQVFIERSKGKKDRYVTLSPVLLDVLRKYVTMQNPRPKEYLFEGQAEGHHYSARSAQAIFNRAVTASGIHKKVSFHALRHSYATHMLEKGVDIKYIKDLLGHFDIKTTERYLHVSREKLIHIQSPLDFLKTDI